MDRDAPPQALVQTLAETPRRIEGAVQRLTAGQLVQPPSPGAWSANEILWHLRAVADVYGEQITRILTEDAPAWRHVSPRARMKKAHYDELPFAGSLTAFMQQRSELVATLGSLPPGAWERAALVRVEQRESRLTLYERILGMADHEELHCAQIEQVAAQL